MCGRFEYFQIMRQVSFIITLVGQYGINSFVYLLKFEPMLPAHRECHSLVHSSLEFRNDRGYNADLRLDVKVVVLMLRDNMDIVQNVEHVGRNF